MYSKKLIYDYFIGNDIEKETLEKLESDNNFLFDVLKLSRDISYYSYLDISYKRSYDVIKYMLLNFKDNLDVYQEDADYLLDSLDVESLEYKEIIVLIAAIDKDSFNDYKISRAGFYVTDKIEVGAVQNSDKELEELIGLGFEVVLSKYEDKPLILDYYALCFLYEIFYQDKNFEEIVHKNIKDKEKLIKIGNIKYLLDYIGSLDYYLKEYLESHIYLLDKLSKDLNLVKNNWDNYINRINEQRVSIVYQEVDKFMEEYRGKFYFDPYSVLDKIIRKYHLENVFELEEELEEFDKLKTKVLKYIMYKKRTEQEIKRKFLNLDNQDMLDAVIENLKEIGYINDESYIERAVVEFMNLNNLSLKELKYKLQSKGVDAGALEDYLYKHEDELQEYETNSAKNIILKKQNSMEEQQLIQYLLKKGYKMESVKEAINYITQE